MRIWRPASPVMIFLLALLVGLVANLPTAWASRCSPAGRSVVTLQGALRPYVLTPHPCKHTLLIAARTAARTGEAKTSLRLGRIALTTPSLLRALGLLSGLIMLPLRQRPPPHALSRSACPFIPDPRAPPIA